MYNKLAIFDFDDTIFKSPGRDLGEKAYLSSTGNKWPHAGWYGRIETLTPPIVPQIPPKDMLIEKTFQEWQKRKQDPNTKTVLLTGRPYKIRHRILEILGHYDMTFDQEFFRGQPGTKGRDTFEIKMNIIQGLLHPELELLEIWEDRPEHVSGFINEFKKLKQSQPYPQKYIVHDAAGKILDSPLVI